MPFSTVAVASGDSEGKLVFASVRNSLLCSERLKELLIACPSVSPVCGS